MVVQLGGRGPHVLAVYALFLGLTTLATILRVYCRRVVMKQFGVPDYLAVLSWAFFACCCSFAIVGVFHGTGQHAWDIHPAADIVTGLKYWWLCEPFYVLSNMAVKGSIAMMLLRLAIERYQRLIIIVVIIVTELYSTAFCLVFLLQCTPSEYFWTRFGGAIGGHCLPTTIILDTVYAYSALMCVTDWTYSILPCILVWNMRRLVTREKILCAIILAMGGIASLATIARVPYISYLSQTNDFLFATTDVAIWSCVETGLAITACSGATMRPLFRQFLRRSSKSPVYSKSTYTEPSYRGAEPAGFSNTLAGIDTDADVFHLSAQSKSAL